MVGPPKSAAVQIVRPPSGASTGKDKGPKESPEKKRETPQRICRNVMIYGFCKFQDAGCIYYHPPAKTDPHGASTPRTGSPAMTQSTPLSKDSKSLSGLGVEHLAAPVFVPKTTFGDAATSPRIPSPVIPAPHAGMQSPSSWPSLSSGAGFMPRQDQTAMTFEETPISLDPSQPVPMESSMYMPPQPIRQQLDYHLYTSPLPHISNNPLHPAHPHSFFISDDLRRTLQARQEAVYAGSIGGSAAGLPTELGVYHSLIPLGHVQGQTPPSRVYGLPSPVYRATSEVDGNAYCLRRVEGFKLVNEAAFGAVDTWRRMRHPNIVGLREAFTTKAFNDDSLILVYDYHPLATTLYDEHLSVDPLPATSSGKRRAGMPIPERVLWSYITQIANALKAIHSSGLAVRNLDPTKVLLTGKNRVRLNGCGIYDVLAYDNQTPIAAFQQEDLVSFGKLIISLCCEFFTPGLPPALPLEHIARHYSPDVKNLVMFLIGKPSITKTIDEALKMMGPRILNELDAMQSYADVLENELGAEVENGRIVRLLTKLGFINERAEFELDPRWSDTGDRYILKLFRDYVFHSVGVDGKPILDLSHVLTCLNKLDSGLDERIMLVSRDDQSCLVVSYREIKHCIEAAFAELRNAGNPLRVNR